MFYYIFQSNVTKFHLSITLFLLLLSEFKMIYIVSCSSYREHARRENRLHDRAILLDAPLEVLIPNRMDNHNEFQDLLDKNKSSLHMSFRLHKTQIFLNILGRGLHNFVMCKNKKMRGQRKGGRTSNKEVQKKHRHPIQN